MRNAYSANRVKPTLGHDDERRAVVHRIATARTLSERQRVNVSWLMEGATCTMWALGCTASLPPFDTQAQLDLRIKRRGGEAVQPSAHIVHVDPSMSHDTFTRCRSERVRAVAIQ